MIIYTQPYLESLSISWHYKKYLIFLPANQLIMIIIHRINYTSIFIFLIVFLVISCAKVGNNKTAFVFVENHKTFLELTGKRRPMAHDLFSVFTSGLIDDTLILQIPELKDGIIDGKDIPVEEDANKYKGHIYINKNQLTVNLQLIDIGAKQVYQESYNGVYELKMK